MAWQVYGWKWLPWHTSSIERYDAWPATSFYRSHFAGWLCFQFHWYSRL